MKLFNSADLYLIGAPNLQPQPYEAQMSGYGNQAQSYGIKNQPYGFQNWQTWVPHQGYGYRGNAVPHGSQTLPYQVGISIDNPYNPNSFAGTVHTYLVLQLFLFPQVIPLYN